MIGNQRSEAEATERILSGATWSEFCDTLKWAGAVVLREGSPTDAFNRAEGFRYLSRILRAGLEAFVEHADPRAPVLQRVVHETAKMGADNPDNHYQNAAISGQYEHRLTGCRGTVRYLSFSTQSGGYGDGIGMPQTGYLEAKDLILDEDGRFEIRLSCERRVRALELPARQPLDGVARLPLLPDQRQQSLCSLSARRLGAHHRLAPGSGVRQLDRSRWARLRHHVLPVVSRPWRRRRRSSSSITRSDTAEIGAHWARKTARMVARAMAARDRAGEGSFLDVSYYDLMKDPLAEVARIYAFIGRPLTAEIRAGIARARQENPQNKHGKHGYRLEDFGLTRAGVEPGFPAYRARFGIPHE